MRVPSICLTFVFTLCSAALAQQVNSLSALPPEGFQFSGSWNCAGNFRGNAVHKASFTGAIILDGKWIELTESDVQPATGYVAKYLLGYDSAEKRLIEFDANNFGAAIYTSDQGWKNGALTMMSALSHDAKADYAANRFRYSIAGKDEFDVDWEISKTADLTWLLADHLVCKRTTT